MTTHRLLLTLTLAALTVAGSGCGSSSSSATPPAAAPASSASAPAASAPAASTVPAAGGGSGQVDAAALCAFLKEELPKLKAVGTKVGAQAQFAIALFDWADPKGLTGAPQLQFDEAAKGTCPDVRDQIVAVTGQTDLLR